MESREKKSLGRIPNKERKNGSTSGSRRLVGENHGIPKSYRIPIPSIDRFDSSRLSRTKSTI